MSDEQILSLEPLLNYIEDPIEAPADYARRVQTLLPNFPEEVITQWFRDHSYTIRERAYLGYQGLRFKQITLSADELKLPGLAENEYVVQYRDYFLGGVDSPRMNRLAAYISEHGTWPVPPLVFDNADGSFSSAGGLGYSRPYDVLEGHHRLAVLYALEKHREGSHAVWLVHR